MDSICTRNDCGSCPGQYVCHCLRITEDEVVGAVTRLGLRTLDELARHTGAGAGCTACHRGLRLLLELTAQASSSPSPICSLR